MDRRATPPKRVTSPIWGTPPPCKQALSVTNYFVQLQFLMFPLYKVEYYISRNSARFRQILMSRFWYFVICTRRYGETAIFGDVHPNYNNMLSNDADYGHSPIWTKAKKVTSFDQKRQNHTCQHKKHCFLKLWILDRVIGQLSGRVWTADCRLRTRGKM